MGLLLYRAAYVPGLLLQHSFRVSNFRSKFHNKGLWQDALQQALFSNISMAKNRYIVVQWYCKDFCINQIHNNLLSDNIYWSSNASFRIEECRMNYVVHRMFEFCTQRVASQVHNKGFFFWGNHPFMSGTPVWNWRWSSSDCGRPFFAAPASLLGGILLSLTYDFHFNTSPLWHKSFLCVSMKSSYELPKASYRFFGCRMLAACERLDWFILPILDSFRKELCGLWYGL